MTAMPLPLSPLQSVLTAVRGLFKLGGYGTVEYAVNQAGDLVPARTIATVKPKTAAERADLGCFWSGCAASTICGPLTRALISYHIDQEPILRTPAGSLVLSILLAAGTSGKRRAWTTTFRSTTFFTSST